MGADLYRITDGPDLDLSTVDYDDPLSYFRDSYNASSLFWIIDLSWWRDIAGYFGPEGDGVVRQVPEGVDSDEQYAENVKIYPAGARRLADECARRAELLVARCKTAGYPATHDTDLSIQYFDTKLATFLRFLREAANAGDCIWCSC